MEFHPQKIRDVIVVESDVYKDDRGFFRELFQQKKYDRGGIDRRFTQDNHSRSKQGVLRGLHYQLRRPQAKLVTAISGRIYDVAVDIRRGSPTFSQWVGVELSPDGPYQEIFVPEGFAHGFCVLSETADVMYKCSDYYEPGDERGILWSDHALGIDWPMRDPLLSAKDATLPELGNVNADRLPVYA